MTSCGGAHYWGRKLQAMGYTLRRIPPQRLKVGVRNAESDARAALA